MLKSCVHTSKLQDYSNSTQHVGSSITADRVFGVLLLWLWCICSNDDVLEEFAPCGDHSKSNGEKRMSTGNLQMMTAFIVKDGRYEASVAILSFTNMQSLQRTSKRT